MPRSQQYSIAEWLYTNLHRHHFEAVNLDRQRHFEVSGGRQSALSSEKSDPSSSQIRHEIELWCAYRVSRFNFSGAPQLANQYRKLIRTIFLGLDLILFLWREPGEYYFAKF